MLERPPRPGRRRAVDLAALRLRDRAQGLRSAECSQPQPRSSANPDASVTVQARPPSRGRASITRQSHAGVMQPPRGSDAGRAAADDRDLDVIVRHADVRDGYLWSW